MKTPLLKAGSFSVVGTDVEFETLLMEVPKELEETEDAETIWIVSYAQKLSKMFMFRLLVSVWFWLHFSSAYG